MHILVRLDDVADAAAFPCSPLLPGIGLSLTRLTHRLRRLLPQPVHRSGLLFIMNELGIRPRPTVAGTPALSVSRATPYKYVRQADLAACPSHRPPARSPLLEHKLSPHMKHSLVIYPVESDMSPPRLCPVSSSVRSCTQRRIRLPRRRTNHLQHHVAPRLLPRLACASSVARGPALEYTRVVYMWQM